MTVQVLRPPVHFQYDFADNDIVPEPSCTPPDASHVAFASAFAIPPLQKIDEIDPGKVDYGELGQLHEEIEDAVRQDETDGSPRDAVRAQGYTPSMYTSLGSLLLLLLLLPFAAPAHVPAPLGTTDRGQSMHWHRSIRSAMPAVQDTVDAPPYPKQSLTLAAAHTLASHRGVDFYYHRS
jgi:hypothetical protein